MSCTEEIWKVAKTSKKIMNDWMLYPYSSSWPSSPDSTFTIMTPQHLDCSQDRSKIHSINETLPCDGSVDSLICTPISIAYTLEVSYIKGIRHITYVKQDPRPFQIEDRVIYTYSTDPELLNTPSDYGPIVSLPNREEWLDHITQRLRDWNEWSITLAALSGLNLPCSDIRSQTNWTFTRTTPTNGSEVDAQEGTFELCDDSSTFQILFPPRFGTV